MNTQILALSIPALALAMLEQQVADFRDQLALVREQLGETQERLDFAERAMLSRPQAPPAPFITPV